MAVNKVILLGRLGKDPEVRYTPQQTAICSFSLATGERRKDQSGNWSEHTEWHNIVTFGKTAQNCGNFLKKGREVFIEGRIQTRKWQDKEGKDRYMTEIIANTVQFVGGKGAGDASHGGGASSGGGHDSNYADTLPSADDLSTSSSGGVSFDDDDIPF